MALTETEKALLSLLWALFLVRKQLYSDTANKVFWRLN